MITHGDDAGAESLLELLDGDHVLVQHQLLLEVVHVGASLLALLVFPGIMLLTLGLKQTAGECHRVSPGNAPDGRYASGTGYLLLRVC